MDSFLFETEGYCAKWKEYPKYQQYQLLLNEKQLLLNKLDEMKKAMGENTKIVELVTHYLKEQCYSSFKRRNVKSKTNPLPLKPKLIS
ncbi:hypothetical protein [Bacillus sp. NPDC094106]|uniref:hypothetical protein n=1 Tax=Bacillus sp. NPDC094106 TaxID=3363949 RepID=UPI003825CC53